MSGKHRTHHGTHRKNRQTVQCGHSETRTVEPIEFGDAQLARAIERIALGDDLLSEVASGLGCSVAELAAMLFDSDSEHCDRAERTLDSIARLMDLHRRCVVDRLGLSALRRLGELIATPLDADPPLGRVRQFESLRRADGESADRETEALHTTAGASRSSGPRATSISPHIHAAESARKVASTILNASSPQPRVAIAGPSIDDVTVLSAMLSDVDDSGPTPGRPP